MKGYNFGQSEKSYSLLHITEAVQQFKNGRKRRANRASNPKRSDFLVPKAIARQPPHPPKVFI